jgi:hypothetical protein
MSSVQLTPNFALSELIESDHAIRHGIDNTPNSPTVMANLYKLAQLLEQIRKVCGGNPVLVSSAYRSPPVNQAVGGSATSEHMLGMAADFRIPRFGNPLQVATAIATSGIKFGQLIFEGTWVHISVADGNNDGDIRTARFTKGADGKTRATYSKGLPK